MILTASPTVIVHSASVDAWLGLIGVVAGVAITTAGNWLQGRSQGRGERQHELDAATGQMVASATSVILLVRDRAAAKSQSGNPTSPNADADWAEKVTSATERMQVADQVVARYGQQGLAAASRNVVTEVLSLALAGGGQGEEREARAAIEKYQDQLAMR